MLIQNRVFIRCFDARFVFASESPLSSESDPPDEVCAEHDDAAAGGEQVHDDAAARGANSLLSKYILLLTAMMLPLDANKCTSTLPRVVRILLSRYIAMPFLVYVCSTASKTLPLVWLVLLLLDLGDCSMAV
ncbi:unnamed protein product [Prorocentrum cordatum]|uniref:Uncharacterized protein n=1 Tax=Prorocentrum cordatum TaxID=2364126 RepID=A0ABN9YG85_9DINO|nr:unnamed protein product [Polarella glacialis]